VTADSNPWLAVRWRTLSRGLREWVAGSPLWTARLPFWTIALTLPPALVLAIASRLQAHYGMPGANLDLPYFPSGHLEAAGRLQMLASWLLMAASGVAALLLFARDLMRMHRVSAGVLLAAYLFLVAYGLMTTRADDKRGPNIIGERTIRLALCVADLDLPDGVPVRVASKQAGSGHHLYRCPKTPEKFVWMKRLNGQQLRLFLFVLPALVLGTISCLGGLPGTAALQARRLKTYLYLSATLMVCGLVFLSALLKWPAYALRGEAAAAYGAHVGGYVLYWGIVYSIVIGAFYVPVALRLGAFVGGAAAVGKAPAAGGSDEAVLGPFDLVKIGAGIFAPAIAALVGQVIDVSR
jgi:hypothetical protein